MCTLSSIALLLTAAVSCSPVTHRFSWGGIWVLVDGQAGLCMCRFMGVTEFQRTTEVTNTEQA